MRVLLFFCLIYIVNAICFTEICKNNICDNPQLFGWMILHFPRMYSNFVEIY